MARHLHTTVERLAKYADERQCLPLLQPHAQALIGRPCSLMSCDVLASRAKVRHKPDQVANSSVDVLYRLGVAGDDHPVVVAVQANALNDIISARFPHDDEMTELPHVLASALERGGELVKYSPSKSCVLRYRDRPGSAGWTYSKTYPPVRAPQIYRRWRQLDTLASGSDGRLRIAESLSFDPRSGTIAQRELVGESLAEALRRSRPSRLAESIAAGLVVIHHSTLDCDEGLEPAARQRQTVRKIKHLVELIPTAAESLATIEALLVSVASSEPSRRCVSFGDFHPGQIVFADGDVSFCDFDSFVLDEPERDLGEFIAASIVGGLGDHATTHAFCLALTNAYRGHAHLDHQRLTWHATVEFVTHVAHSARALRPGWAGTVLSAAAKYPELRRVLDDAA